jgi:thiamine kinase-like enzyme
MRHVSMTVSDESNRKSKIELSELIHHLDTVRDAQQHTWKDWKIRPMAGGANNRLFRATGDLGDLVVKFTIRDQRDRAGREFAALSALHQVSKHLAPRAVWLDRQSFNQPVIVQTWLRGEALTSPPQTLQDWKALADHYCAIHQLDPEKTEVRISPAVLNAASGEGGKALIQRHLECIPVQFQPERLQTLIKRFEAWVPPQWPVPGFRLCRVDANWRNFIRRRTTWASVDWENSGWGDPVFEIADLVTHPAYLDISDPLWEWLITYYAKQMDDKDAPLRIQAYRIIMLVWWTVRWQRYLYEVPRGLDPRLVVRSLSWRETIEHHYLYYLNLAEGTLP